MTNTHKLAIGITEGGDPAFGSWQSDLAAVDGAIVITKNLHDRLIADILDVNRTKPICVHATCTGWGGTKMEPGVPSPEHQLEQISKLIAAGFPRNRITLRIDPIIDIGNGVDVAASVAMAAVEKKILNPGASDNIRLRVSIMDCYGHAQKRFQKRGIAIPPRGERFGQPAASTIQKIIAAFKPLTDAGLEIETCAEALLKTNAGFVQHGCLSAYDLDVMGIAYNLNTLEKCRQRAACSCLGIKRELLPIKHPCPHQCAYCYWKD